MYTKDLQISNYVIYITKKSRHTSMEWNMTVQSTK